MLLPVVSRDWLLLSKERVPFLTQSRLLACTQGTIKITPTLNKVDLYNQKDITEEKV